MPAGPTIEVQNISVRVHNPLLDRLLHGALHGLQMVDYNNGGHSIETCAATHCQFLGAKTRNHNFSFKVLAQSWCIPVNPPQDVLPVDSERSE